MYNVMVKSVRQCLIFLAPVIFLVAACDNQITDPGQNNENGNGEPDRSENLKGVGDSAGDLLSDDNYNSLIVQVQYMEGAGPTQAALDKLETFLEERVHKAGIEIRVDDPIPSGGKEKYSFGEIRDLEDEHRTEFTRGETIAAYYIFLDGGSDQDSNNSYILGAAYRNTSMVMFQDNIERVSGGIGGPSKETVETTVLNHEFGHIFSLVGIGYEAGHKDADHGNHCDNDRCLMYYTATTNDIVELITGGSVPELDQNCIDDLRSKGGR